MEVDPLWKAPRRAKAVCVEAGMEALRRGASELCHEERDRAGSRRWRRCGEDLWKVDGKSMKNFDKSWDHIIYIYISQ